MLVKLVFIFGKIKDDKCVFFHGLRSRRLIDFSIIADIEGFLLACYDVCILLSDIWYMYFVPSFSPNSIGVLCRVSQKGSVPGNVVCPVPTTSCQVVGLVRLKASNVVC